jgi:ABC-type transport system involved in multi-copper enzyme maturation permease subunit
MTTSTPSFTSSWPSIWTIAKNTFKEIIRERLLYGILLMAVLLTASSFFLATVSLEQNARVLQNVGIAAIHLFTFGICVFVATNSLAKDVDRRALYLLFSKPISRPQYVLGKYIGFLLLLITALVLLGGLFTAGLMFTDKSLLPGTLINLCYSFFEISFLLAWSVLFASFTAPLNAALYTVALFIIGHSLETLRAYAEKLGSASLHAVTNICYYLLPNLEKFDVRRSILYGLHIPAQSVIWMIVYWAFYTGFVLFLAIRVMSTLEF